MSIEQAVHCHVVGQGPALVLLHGWGVNAAVWQPVIDNLSRHFTLYLVDLPGFGNSAPLPDYSLASISAAILQVVPEYAVWCGWSLGGLIATYAALHHTPRVTRLIQVASSAKFVADANWAGVEPTVFDNFQQGLQANLAKTLTRFIALQAMGCTSARKDSAALKKLLSGSKAADRKALEAGLRLLAESDLRLSLPRLQQPCLALFGQFDSLVPLPATQAIAALIPRVQVHVFERSSHAPFISEKDQFCSKIVDFMSD